jgi:phosphoribosylaminoimidazole-succinocarboxamide synthase
MNAHLPRGVAQSELTTTLLEASLLRVHSGKVRDSFSIPDHPDKLLVLATNRISIFDFVLNALVPQKGEILTALTTFWLTRVLCGYSHHLVAFGNHIDGFLPKSLWNSPVLQRRALVVKRVEMYPAELIVRGYLTGSGWKSYCRERRICGIPLPNGYHDGSKLLQAIFTPTTKAAEGHDQDIPSSSVPELLSGLALTWYSIAAEYATWRGIIIADTKFEADWDGKLADEVLTPDSSRFWLQSDWELAAKQGHSPTGFDKEPVRDWGRQVVANITSSGEAVVGINNLHPEVLAEREFVHSLEVPAEVLTDTTRRYRQIFQMLTGVELELFQRHDMGIQG